MAGRVEVIIQAEDAVLYLVSLAEGLPLALQRLAGEWAHKLAGEAAEGAPLGVTGELRAGLAASGFVRAAPDGLEFGYGVPADVPYGWWINAGTDVDGRPLPDRWFVPFAVSPSLLMWARRVAGMDVEEAPGSRWGFRPPGMWIRRQEKRYLERPLQQNAEAIRADIESTVVRGAGGG